MTLLSSVQQWFGRTQSRVLQPLSDAELLQRYQQRSDTPALDSLIARHCDALYHFLLTLADAVLAEDISQLTWVKLIEQPQRYQPGSASFRTWLFTSARNALIDELRRQNRWQWQSLEDTDDLGIEHPDTLTLNLQTDLQQKFDSALSALPFVQREALMLQLEGFSLDEISRITGDRAETIKSRLRFARRTLTHLLEAEA